MGKKFNPDPPADEPSSADNALEQANLARYEGCNDAADLLMEIHIMELEHEGE